MSSPAVHIPTFIRFARTLYVAAPKFARQLLAIWRRTWRAALWGTTILVIAVLGHDAVAGLRWTFYRRAAAARGLALERPERVPPPISNRENFVGADSPFSSDAHSVTWLADFTGIHFCFPDLGRATRMTTEQAYAGYSSPRSFRKASSSTSQLPSPLDDPKTADDFLAVFERNFGSQWPAILQAESRPKTQFAPKSAHASDFRQINALVVRKTAQLHWMRAMALHDLGRHREAFKEVQSVFQLAHDIEAGGTPILASYMIETAILCGNMSAVWAGLVDREWSTAELEALQNELLSLHPETHWPAMTDAERQWENSVYDECAAASPTKRWKLVSSPNDRLNCARMTLLTSTKGLIRDSQLITNQYWDAARQWIGPDGLWRPVIESASCNFEHLTAWEKNRYALAAILTPSVKRAAARLILTEACLREGAVAVALERYRRRHQDLPQNLEALVPEYLAALPEDPINGGPIDYTRESAEAYRLSCPDGRDTPGGISIGEVWDGPKVNGQVDVVWHGLAPYK